MNVTDEAVMLAVQEDDIGQLGTLFERHCKRLFDYFFRMTGNRTASEDLVQEVFVRMLKYRHTFGKDSHFKGWMFGIARNARIQYFKTKLRNPGDMAQSDFVIQVQSIFMAGPISLSVPVAADGSFVSPPLPAGTYGAMIFYHSSTATAPVSTSDRKSIVVSDKDVTDLELAISAPPR